MERAMASDSILIQVQLANPTKANITAVTRQIQAGLRNISADVQIKNGAAAERTLGNLKKGADGAAKGMNNFGEAIGLSARRFVAFTSAVAVVGRLTSALSRGTREAIKFEREFVKLAQVFDVNVNSLGGLSRSISDLSREFGLSANVITKTSVILAQSGLTAKQTEQAMRTLAKTTLAATFDSIASSTEGAVAIMNQFNTEAGLLETQLGAINAVSKKFAVESGDIIEAVRRSGGAFRAAGGTLNEFIALFTSVRSTTRESAETIATGFRTIFARLQRPKTIDFFRQLNIELTDGQGNFIGAFKAIRRLSRGLEEAGIKAGSIQFAGVVEQLGGIRQVSRVIPLLQQFTKAEKARQVAIAGGGSLDKDAAKAQATLAQSFARTTENFSALIREISQTSSFQSIVKIALDMANAFIEVARSLKPLIPLIAAFGAIKLTGILGSAVRKGFGGSTKETLLAAKRGGPVPGSGSGDIVPAMLEPGEFVIRKSAVQAFGAGNLAGINKYANGAGKKGVTAETKPKIIRANIGQIFPSGTPSGPTTTTVTHRGVLFEGKPSNHVLKEDGFTGLADELVPAASKAMQGIIQDKLGSKFKGSSKIEESQGFKNAVKGFGFESYIDFIKGQASNRPGDPPFDFKRGQTKGLSKLTDSSVGNDIFLDATTNNKRSKEAIVRKAANQFFPKTIARKQPKAKASGGSITGTDTVPALLTPGEFVVNKESAKAFGYGKLGKINKYAKGGAVQKFQSGGEVDSGGVLGLGSITELVVVAGLATSGLKQLSDVSKQVKEKFKGFGKSLKETNDLRKSFNVRLKQKVDELNRLQIAKSKVAGKAVAANVRGKPLSGRALDNNTRRTRKIQGEIDKINRDIGTLKRDKPKLAGLGSETRKSFGIGGLGRSRVVTGAVGSVGKIDPLVATAGLFATLNTVLAANVEAHTKEKELAIESGDVAAASAAAAAESQNKSTKALALGGAAAGAAIGSVVPVLGTFVGGLVGATVGVAVSFYAPIKDFGAGILNTIGIFGEFKTSAEKRLEAEKKAADAAKSTNIQKDLDRLGTQFRNASRDLDPKKNFGGFAAEANKLAAATTAQKVAALNLAADAPGRAEKIKQANEQVQNAFKQLAEAGAAQGKSFEQVKASAPELFKAFEASLPPAESASIIRANTEAHNAQVAVLRAEEQARQRATAIFLEQIAIQDRLNASLAAFDESLKGQQQAIAGLDFALTGQVAIPEVGASLTDFSQAGTAEFNQGLAEVSKLGPDFAREAQKVKGGLAQFDGFAESLASGDAAKAASDITKGLSGILSPTQLAEIQKQVADFKGDGKAAAALEEALIKEFVGPFAETLEQGRSKINKSVENYNTILDKRNEIERRSLQKRLEILQQEQDIKKQIQEIAGIDISAGQARGRSTAQARTALGGTGLGGSLTGNRAADVAFLGQKSQTNKGAQSILQQQISSGKLNVEQLNKANKGLKDLQLESEQLENAMGLLSDVTEENAAIQKKFEQSRAEREAKKEVATSLAFGTQESRGKFFDTLGAAQKVGAAGSAEVIPEGQRSDVLNLLKQFSGARVFGGRTGKEAEEAATSNFLLNTLGIPIEQVAEVMQDFTIGELDMLGAIQRNLSVDLDRNKILLDIKSKLEPQQAQGNATGGLIYANEGTLVNFKPKGTDTVPAMLTPGEFVVKKSSVNKYGTGMMESINAGNFADGGEVNTNFDRGKPFNRFNTAGIFRPGQIEDIFVKALSIPKVAGKFSLLTPDDKKPTPLVDIFREQAGGKPTEYIDILKRAFSKSVFGAGKAYETILKNLFGIEGDKTVPGPLLGAVTQGANTFFIRNPKKGIAKKALEEAKGAINVITNGSQKEGGLDGTNVAYIVNTLSQDKLRKQISSLLKGEIIADPVLKMNTGGPVGGAPGIDANPAMLTRGEYVINKQSAQAIGPNNLNRLNSIKGYNKGGPVGYFANGGQPLSSPSRSQLLLNQSQPKIDLESKDFTTSVSDFTRAIEEFNEVPKDFTMTVAPSQVTVTLNGAEILAQIMPEIQSEILSQTSFKIEEFRQQLKSGDV
jgi:TP901 family phage tail tape measure protein